MPWGKDRTLQEIETFIRSARLRKKLRRDLLKHRIVKEADFQSTVYYHLRRYIGEDGRWRILNGRYVPIIGRYPDLLIFGNGQPAVAIELKWNKMNIGKKDRRTLYEAITKLNVQKAYWLSVLYSDKRGKKRLHKRLKEKNVLHLIRVRLGLAGRMLYEYKRGRKTYTSKMPRGKGRK